MSCASTEGLAAIGQRYTQALPYQPSASQQQQRLPAVGSVFHFTSARQPFSIKQDVVDSTQRGADMTDGGAPAPPEPTSSTPTVAEWLHTLGLSAYADNFTTAGFTSMEQLKSAQNFTIKDLENMQLTRDTIAKIWTSLKGYRLAFTELRDRGSRDSVVTLQDASILPDSQGSSSGSESANLRQSVSLQSLDSRTAASAGRLSFTKCSVKFTTILKRKATQSTDDHPAKLAKTEEMADTKSDEAKHSDTIKKE